MNYIEAVEYIHSLLKFGVRPGLSGMDALLCALNNPHKNLKYVHVAGTNGKGSVSTAISNVLIESGYKVGLYTSPYVTDFLERVQFNGQPVGRAVFAQSVKNVKNAVEELEKSDIVITEFEALTAAAFLCFDALKCDIVVLEVGLGGRLDATNVIGTPLVNVITSLSIDHSAILGDTIEQIAYEKCGTIKEGSKVVCSFSQPEGAFDVVEKTVKDKSASLVIPDINALEVIKTDIFGTDFIYKGKGYKIALPGEHQLKNMTSVIEACKILGETFNISYESVFKGISKTILPARVEVIRKRPLVILDGGHNKDGATAFYNAVRSEITEKDKIIVIAGMMADKEVESSLFSLISTADIFVAVTPDNPRAMNAVELGTIARKYCNNVLEMDDPVKAVEYCASILSENDMLCIVGSLYLAGEVRTTCLELF